MSFTQTILGFGQGTIKYCSKCNVKYNVTNEKDMKFHQKLHREHIIPKCEEIAKCFYQKKSVFYYGEKEIKASCKVKKSKLGVLFHNFWSDSEESKEKLISNLRLIYTNSSTSK